MKFSRITLVANWAQITTTSSSSTLSDRLISPEVRSKIVIEILRYFPLIISTAIVLHTFHYSAFPTDQIIVDIMFPANLSVVN